MNNTEITRNSIDVIIPVFNGEQFIKIALSSIESQTLKPQNIIIVDDGSTDETENIVAEYKTICPIPITYIKKANAGPNSARNAGIRSSSADYLAFLDADDEWTATKLEEQMTVFLSSDLKDLGVVYCQYSLIDENNETIALGKTVAFNSGIRGDVFKKLLQGNMVTGSASAVVIKKECFETVGLFDESLKAAEDWDMWLRIAEKYSFDYADKPLVKIRRHPGSFQNKYEYMLIHDIAFYNKWVSRLSPAEIPYKWKDNIATLIFLGLPGLKFIAIAKKALTQEAYDFFFKRYGGLEIFICIAFIRKLVKLALSPRLLAARLKLYQNHAS